MTLISKAFLDMTVKARETKTKVDLINIITRAGEDMEEVAPSYTIGGVYSDAATLENSLAGPQPLTSELNISTSKSPPRYTPKDAENTHTKACTQMLEATFL